MDKTDKEIPQSFDHHILLYSKNWYKKSDDPIADIKQLLAQYAWLEYQNISDIEVRQLLADCWVKYCPEFERGKALQEMLGWHWYSGVMKRTPEQIMLGTMSCCEGKYVDPTQLLPVLVKEKTCTTQ